MSSASENVTFRLKTELVRKLDARRDPMGDSRGEYARRVIIAHLNERHHEEVLDQLTQLRQAVAVVDDEIHDQSGSLTLAIRRLAFVLLTTVPPVTSEEAKSIARRIASLDTE